MQNQNFSKEELIRKISHLSTDRLIQVYDFIDFLIKKEDEKRLAQTFTKLSEKSFEKIWDNSEDSVYDKL